MTRRKLDPEMVAALKQVDPNWSGRAPRVPKPFQLSPEGQAALTRLLEPQVRIPLSQAKDLVAQLRAAGLDRAAEELEAESYRA